MGIYSWIYSQSGAQITNWIYDQHPELEGSLELPVCSQLVISTGTTKAWGWHLKWRVISWDWAIFTYELFFFFPPFIFISWRLITLQYCSGFCHTLTWISHGFTCIPGPDPPSHLPLHPIPLGLPSAPGPSTCLMHPAWAGDLFHPR